MTVNIMIVDDAQIMREILKSMVNKQGLKVVAEAESGKESVEMYKKLLKTSNKPHIVLMDITMDGMSGIEALEKILKIDSAANVVMCSAMSGQQSMIEAFGKGAKGFISKPFTDEQVLKEIEEVIKKYLSGR